MNFRQHAFYIGYHHLTYACFVFIFIQIVFLICIQTLNQRQVAHNFEQQQANISQTIRSNMESLNVNQSTRPIIKQFKTNVLPSVKQLASKQNMLTEWHIRSHRQTAYNQSIPFYVTNYQANPFLISIHLPGQDIVIDLHFKVTPSLFWDSFMVSIFLMLAFIISWVIFIYGFNYSFKARILKGFLTRHDNSPSTYQEPKDLTGELISEIQALMDQKSIMLSALSHDLKTPLTELELKLYLLDDQTLAQQLLSLTKEINQIVQTSLQYAKGYGHVQKIPTNICQFISELAQQMHTQQKPVTFSSDYQTLQYPIEPILFKRMFVNLINNAKNYGNSCHIHVSKNTNGYIEIAVEDNGPGVSEAELKLLEKPFFRTDASRSKKTGGSGLGLAIVKQIAQIHSMLLSFHNRSEGGLSVKLTACAN